MSGTPKNCHQGTFYIATVGARVHFNRLKRVSACLAALSCFSSVQADRIDELIAAEMKRQHIPGLSVSIVKTGKIIKARGYGLADLEHEVPVSSKTMFHSASLGKQFTAALITLLIEDGMVDIDHQISIYLPNVPESWAEITIRHLLNHTSGLAPADPSIDLHRDYSDEELLLSMAKIPLLFSPGEEWSYSNLGYQVLGIMCSRIGGKFYGDQLRERIFVPTGMNATIVTDRVIVPNRAAGYDRVNAAFLNQEWVAPSLNATADGGMYVSARDLARWSIALEGSNVLSKSSKVDSWTPAKLNDGTSTEYGYGWEVRSMNGHRAVLHGGAWQGFSTYIVHFPEDKVTVAVLTNRSRARPEYIAERLVGLYIPDLKISPPTKATFSSVDAFVRGSMNGWRADRDRLVQMTNGIYEAQIDLEPGSNMFRIASQDWTSIDLGGSFDQPTVNLEASTPIEFRGENLVVDVPEAAPYLFLLDVRDTDKPRLTVRKQASTVEASSAR